MGSRVQQGKALRERTSVARNVLRAPELNHTGNRLFF